MTSHTPPAFLASIRAGWEACVAAPPRQKFVLAILLLLSLVMLPIGRTGPDDSGGLLRPLTVDGFLFKQALAMDYFSVYDAGSRALAGEDPYGVNRSEGVGFRAPYVATYRYPPLTTFWLTVPLNVLPPWPSYYAWVGVLYGLVLSGFLWSVGRRPELLLPLGLVWLAWFPLIAEYHMGQFTLFMAVLMLWGLDAAVRGARGSVAWALAVMVKVYPICMAPSLWLWGRRWLAAGTVGVLVGTTLLWRVLVPSGVEEGMWNRGVEGRVIGGMRNPYGGAQGVQEGITAILWKLQGRSLNPHVPYTAPPPLEDVAVWANGLVLGLFGLMCLWALIVTRRQLSVPALGLFWMAWFYAYRDCWEHHYLLMPPLLAFLAAYRVIGWRTLVFCWLFAGTPSLWWFWQRTGISGNLLAETIGLLYFLQRPIAVLGLTGLLALKVRRGNGE